MGAGRGDGTGGRRAGSWARWAAVPGLATLLLVAGGCAGPPLYGWAQESERQQCVRDANWWKPHDGIDGTGRCEYVNVED